MPYHIVKSSTGYYVENKDTGRRHSTDPMTLKNAKAQLRILESAMKRERR